MKKRKGLLACVLLVGLLLGLGSTAVVADGSEPLLQEDAGQAWVKLSGAVVSRPAGDTVGAWVIGGRAVQVIGDTVLDETLGPAVVRARVAVLARRAWTVPTEDGARMPRPVVRLEAVLIRVLAPAQFSGRVAIRGWVMDLQPTLLVVNGLQILYDRSTDISGDLRVGALVKVIVFQTDAGLKALSIEVLPASQRVVYFQGVIQSIGRSLWVVGGQRVMIGLHTVILGRRVVGLQARVWALVTPSVDSSVLPNRQLLAIFIQVLDEPVIVEWTGPIERLPANITIWPPVYTGQWVVGRRAVWVTRESEIIGTPRIGLRAHVQAYRDPKYQLVAKKIEILAITPLAREQ